MSRNFLRNVLPTLQRDAAVYSELEDTNEMILAGIQQQAQAMEREYDALQASTADRELKIKQLSDLMVNRKEFGRPSVIEKYHRMLEPDSSKELHVVFKETTELHRSINNYEHELRKQSDEAHKLQSALDDGTREGERLAEKLRRQTVTSERSLATHKNEVSALETTLQTERDCAKRLRESNNNLLAEIERAEARAEKQNAQGEKRYDELKRQIQSAQQAHARKTEEVTTLKKQLAVDRVASGKELTRLENSKDAQMEVLQDAIDSLQRELATAQADRAIDRAASTADQTTIEALRDELSSAYDAHDAGVKAAIEVRRDLDSARQEIKTTRENTDRIRAELSTAKGAQSSAETVNEQLRSEKAAMIGKHEAEVQTIRADAERLDKARTTTITTMEKRQKELEVDQVLGRDEQKRLAKALADAQVSAKAADDRFRAEVAEMRESHEKETQATKAAAETQGRTDQSEIDDLKKQQAELREAQKSMAESHEKEIQAIEAAAEKQDEIREAEIEVLEKQLAELKDSQVVNKKLQAETDEAQAVAFTEIQHENQRLEDQLATVTMLADMRQNDLENARTVASERARDLQETRDRVLSVANERTTLKARLQATQNQFESTTTELRAATETRLHQQQHSYQSELATITGDFNARLADRDAEIARQASAITQQALKIDEHMDMIIAYQGTISDQHTLNASQALKIQEQEGAIAGFQARIAANESVIANGNIKIVDMGAEVRRQHQKVAQLSALQSQLVDAERSLRDENSALLADHHAAVEAMCREIAQRDFAMESNQRIVERSKSWYSATISALAERSDRKVTAAQKERDAVAAELQTSQERHRRNRRVLRRQYRSLEVKLYDLADSREVVRNELAAQGWEFVAQSVMYNDVQAQLAEVHDTHTALCAEVNALAGDLDTMQQAKGHVETEKEGLEELFRMAQKDQTGLRAEVKSLQGDVDALRQAKEQVETEKTDLKIQSDEKQTALRAEVDVLKTSLDSLQQAKDHVKMEKEGLESQFRKAENTQTVLRAEVEVLQGDVDTLRRAREQVETEKTDLKSQSEEKHTALRAEVEGLKSDLDALRRAKEHVVAEKDRLVDHVNAEQEVRTTLQAQVKVLETELHALRQAKEQVAVEKDDLDAQVRVGQAEQTALRSEIEGLKGDLDTSRRAREHVEAEKDELDSQVRAGREEQIGLRTKVERLEDDFDTLREAKEQLATDKVDLEVRVRAEQDKQTVLRVEAEALRAEAEALNADVDTLRQAKDQLETEKTDLDSQQEEKQTALRAEVEVLKGDLDTLREAKGQLEAENDRLDSRVCVEKAEQTALRVVIGNLRDDIRAIRQAKEQVAAEKEDLVGRVYAEQEKHIILQDERDVFKADLDDMREAKEDVERQFEEIRAWVSESMATHRRLTAETANADRQATNGLVRQREELFSVVRQLVPENDASERQRIAQCAMQNYEIPTYRSLFSWDP